MNKEKIEKFFCNICKGKTNHFIRGEHSSIDRDDWDGTSLTLHLLIVECCGCENLALVKKTHFSEHIVFHRDPVLGKDTMEPLWDVSIRGRSRIVSWLEVSLKLNSGDNCLLYTVG